MKLSVISPVYMAEKIVPELVKQVKSAVKGLTEDFEIILVEDGSKDNSWGAIEAECSKDKRIKGIKLSRNFGQHYAITAGINAAVGDNIVLMDCDLQDNPKHIQVLMEKRNEGYEIVFTKRKKRKHGLIKTLNSKIYNALFRIFSDKNYDINIGSLVLFSKRVQKEFLRLKDAERLYIQFLKWLGFETTTVEVEHNPRWEGKSSYNFFKLVKLGIQGWTAHSDKLL
ncbi:MAG: glycosyltransferase family 2 protein, partial [Fulvivirga sp.]|nr:glycosyltransferase family 2 protein [Fulvivirga sp.]